MAEVRADDWIERIGELYRLNEARIEQGRDLNAPELPAPLARMDVARMNTPAYAQTQQALVQQVATLAQARDAQLAQAALPSPRRKILAGLREHWEGLTLFVEQPEIPMDNNVCYAASGIMLSGVSGMARPKMRFSPTA